MVNRTRQWIMTIIFGALVICCVSRELRSPKQQASTQAPTATSQPRSVAIPRPSPTMRPSPTPRKPITGPSAEELRTKWDELTDLQRNTYAREVRGSYIRWDAQVVEVHPSGTVNALAMVGTKALVMLFDLPQSEARRLNKEQAITIEGTIRVIGPPIAGDGGLVEGLVRSLSLFVELDDVVVLGVSRRAAPLPSTVPTRVTRPVATTGPIPTVDVSACTLDMAFVSEDAIYDGRIMPSRRTQDKMWTVRNTGTCVWGPGFELVRMGDDKLATQDRAPVGECPPGEEVTLKVGIRVPDTKGTYRSDWRLCANGDQCFGPTLYVVIESTGLPASMR